MKKHPVILPRSVFVRFTLAFILVGLLPLFIFNIATLRHSSAMVEENAIGSTRQMLTVVADNLNARFEDVAHQSTMMYYYDSATYGTLREILTLSQMEVNPYFGMRDFTKNMLDSNSSLKSVFFYDSINQKTYYAQEAGAKSVIADFDWGGLSYVREALANPRELIISSPHSDSYCLNSTQKVITFCRAYIDTSKLPMAQTVLGVIMLDVPYSYLSESLRAYDWEGNGELHIVDINGTSLYGSNEQLVGTINPLGVSPQTLIAQGERDMFEDSGGRIVFRAMPATNWQIQYKLNMKAVTAQIDRLREYTLWMIALSALCAIGLAVLCSRSLSAPIKRLLKQMKRIQNGDLTARVSPIGQGEFGELNEGFNQMVVELDSYINKSLLARIGQTEAELNELKMQIHPHFLYNTLEVIRMTALDEGGQKTAVMVEALARQLKYVIGELHDRVPLYREVEMTRNYISLIAMRYGDIVMNTKIPSCLAHCLVLKLCLQPVVENAVQHGLRPNGGGCIELSVEREADDLLIMVMDDGVGMDRTQVAQLNQKLQGEKLVPDISAEGIRGIGLKNVHDRLRFACGEQYGLMVQSMEAVGTVVVIRLPYEKEEQSDETVIRG